MAKESKQIPPAVIAAAQAGEAQALEALVRAVQNRVHHLALRMLADPALAQDATQEILIRLVTKLSTFRGEARFSTWVYRIATNYLLTARKVLARDPGLRFEMFEADLLDGLADPAQAAPEDHVMLNELRLRCTMAMLLCLDRDHRAAYVLGDILELSQSEAADALEITPANYRQRLSRARAKVTDFTARSCGVARAGAACSCPRRLPAAQAMGRLGDQPDPLLAGAQGYEAAVQMARQTSADLVAGKLQQGAAPKEAPVDYARAILRMVETHADTPPPS